jgi:ATP-dependent DNA helicase RecG
MDIHQVEKIAERGESNNLEFKKSTAELVSAIKTLCGFLNRDGGQVLIGVTDSKRIVGQHVSDHTRLEIANWIKKIEPTPVVDIHYANISNSTRQVILLTAHHDEYAIPYVFEGKAYERLETSTFPMPQERYQRLLLEKTQKNRGWEDGIARELTLDDLDHNEIIKTIQMGVSKGRIPPTKATTDPTEALIRLHLVRNKHFINAAIVLFAKEPTRWLPQCKIRLARFRGKDKRDFIDNRQVEGNAFHLLEETLIFTQRHLPIASRFEAGNIERIDEPLVPIDALREIFVNSICHRDYRSTGGSISCAIYEDKMEVWNDGSLPEGFHFSELKFLHESKPRNPRIARAFYCRKLFDHWGGGIELVSNLSQQVGNPEPEFFERSGGFCVKLPFKHSMEPLQIKTTTMLQVRLKPRQNEILELLKDNKVLSGSEIQTKLSEPTTLRTVQMDLSTLKKHGLVESQGKGRTTTWKRKV